MGNPHDAIFRFVFGDLQHAEGLLRRLLPPPLRAPLARRRITVAPASTSGTNLRQHHADLLYCTRHPDLGQAILLLLEHKSGRDHRLTRQLLRYVVHLGPAWSNRRGLPPFFVPLVVHHGTRPLAAMTWRPRPRKAAAAEGLFAVLQPLDPTLRISAWDLTGCGEADLMAEPLTALARLCLLFLQFLPRASEAACRERLHRWAALLREAAAAPGGHLGIQQLHSYLLHVTNVSANRLAATFAEILHPAFEHTMITTAQRLRAEGRAEGKAEGKAELLLRQLAAKFGSVPEALAHRVRTAAADQLDTFGLRLLTAHSVDDVFGTE